MLPIEAGLSNAWYSKYCLGINHIIYAALVAALAGLSASVKYTNSPDSRMAYNSCPHSTENPCVNKVYLYPETCEQRSCVLV